MAVIGCTGLAAGFRERRVLTDVTFTVRSGARVALLGANGTGKSTLLRCLAGAQRPSAGTVERAGAAISFTSAGLAAHRREVQLVLQDPDLQLFSADVRQDVSFGPMNLGLPASEVMERVTAGLVAVGAEHLVDRPTHQLSYGERKRVTLAGALALRPSVLLLDEPTAGLDVSGEDDLLDSLDALAGAGTAVVAAMHDVGMARAWADVVLVLTSCDGGASTVATYVAPPDDSVLAAAGLLSRRRVGRMPGELPPG